MAASRVLLAGGTGFVGGLLTERLAASGRSVTVLARRNTPMPRSVQTLLSDFKRKPEELGDYDAVFLCLGTTPTRAGSKDAFYEIEHDATLQVARWGKECGARKCGYISSLGADIHSSSFYLKTKAETEAGLSELNFEQLSLFRPSFLTGRPQPLLSERIGGALFGVIAKFGSRSLMPIEGKKVADAMMATLDNKTGGERRLHSQEMM